MTIKTGYVAVKGDAIEANVFVKASHRSKTPKMFSTEPIIANLYFLKSSIALEIPLIDCFSSFKYTSATGICTKASAKRKSCIEILSIAFLDNESLKPMAIAPESAQNTKPFFLKSVSLKFFSVDTINVPKTVNEIARI